MVKPSDKTVRLNGGSPERKILAAAREEFIDQGLGGARMQAIADRAGVNKALLHYYFRSKERLYKVALADIITTIGNSLRAELGAYGDDEGLRPLLRTVVTVYVRTFQKNPDFPRFMAREMIEGGAHLKEIVGTFVETFGDIPLRLYAQIVKEQQSGNVRDIPPIQIAINLASMSIFAFIARPMLEVIRERAGLDLSIDNDAFANDRIESIVTMACDGIFKEKSR